MPRKSIVLQPGEGRHYALGTLSAVFKADEEETDCRYSVSEWNLDPGCEGVGAHSHDANDEVFYVLAGSASILIGDLWSDFEAGAFVRIPATLAHDFRNVSGQPARLLNFFIPGGFERNMPSIVEWFASRPR